jgi:class 3 adenylate cyclase
MHEPRDDTWTEVLTEAIVVIDIVESTITSNLFGWYTVGRAAFRDLRALISQAGGGRGLRVLKSTGDGFLVTFHDARSAEAAAVAATEAIFDLYDRVANRNRSVSEEKALTLRSAIHIGEVDALQNDSAGPHVTLAFRVEGISRASLPAALNPIRPEELPLQDYVLCSEEVAGILARRSAPWTTRCIGAFRLKGFPGFREVFHLTPAHA